MEMNRMSDYYRVYPVHQVKAIDPSGMNVNPDRKNRGRQEKQKGFSLSEKEERQGDSSAEDLQNRNVRREIQEELSPLMLWMVMSGKSRMLKY